jgi:hypothetical protein
VLLRPDVGSPSGAGVHRHQLSPIPKPPVAGDWIYTGLNVGNLEGAVMSGKLASFAVSGAPALSTIIGYPQATPAV